MTKFRFYQDKEVLTWVRDYFEVEADNLEDAIAHVKRMGTLEDAEDDKDSRVSFLRRDWDWMYDCLADCANENETSRFLIFSCDLESQAGMIDSEVAGKY